MSGYHRMWKWWQFSFDNMKIGAANPAGFNLNPDFFLPRLWIWYFFKFKRVRLNGSAFFQNHSFHASYLSLYG
jgi:hypothetical protein